MLGPLVVERAAQAMALPASRKARALFAYLAMAPLAVSRSRLCELLWDGPSDPRGELRWCLSKLRGLVDAPGRCRIETHDDTVRIDLEGADVDALDVLASAGQGMAELTAERQRALLARFRGEFLEGLDVDHTAPLAAWLTAQRRRFRATQVALLEHLSASATAEDELGYVEQWLLLAPFDIAAHERLLRALARRRDVQGAERHLDAAIRRFEDDGLDSGPLHHAWRAARSSSSTGVAPPAITGGSRFVAPADDGAVVVAPSPAASPRRASVAVMPFSDFSTRAAQGGVADALAHDVITRLAKLRVLFVIAQGSVFALHERRIGAEEAGRMLNVDYVVSGSVHERSGRLHVGVELTETRTARIVWAESFDQRSDDALAILEEIGDRIVASVASEIEAVERNRAILRPPTSLDAWEAHHRGLWHMYRFTQADNAEAQRFFQTAVRLDPTFSRAHAGLSFTHFQNAFQGWGARAAAIDAAYAAAGQSVIVDDRDPAAHWAMGRALWLRERQDQAIDELQHAIDLSPNFALAHYTLAFVQSQGGDPDAAIASSDHSRSLSPFDPLLFGMLGARALALVRLGRFEEAAQWASKAAQRPNAHAHILAIAAYASALAGALEPARNYAATIRRSLPAYGIADFLRAFHLEPEGEALFRQGARRLGMR